MDRGTESKTFMQEAQAPMMKRGTTFAPSRQTRGRSQTLPEAIEHLFDEDEDEEFEVSTSPAQCMSSTVGCKVGDEDPDVAKLLDRPEFRHRRKKKKAVKSSMSLERLGGEAGDDDDVDYAMEEEMEAEVDDTQGESGVCATVMLLLKYSPHSCSGPI